MSVPTMPPQDRARSQAMAQRRNLLNIERELLADAANIQRHAASIRKAIDQLEREHKLHGYSDDAQERASVPMYPTASGKSSPTGID